MSGISFLGAGRVPFDLRSNAKVGVSIGTEGKTTITTALSGSDIADDSDAPGATITDVLNFLFATRGPIRRWANFHRYFASSITGTTTVSTAVTTGFIFYSPFYIPDDYHLGLISAEVTNAGSGLNRNIRLGIYDDNDGDPGDRLFDSGDLPSTSIGVKTASLAALPNPFPGGHYWLAFTGGNATNQMKSAQLADTAPWLGEKDSGPFAAGIVARTEAHAYGALPATANGITESATPLTMIAVSRIP